MLVKAQRPENLPIIPSICRVAAVTNKLHCCAGVLLGTMSHPAALSARTPVVPFTSRIASRSRNERSQKLVRLPGQSLHQQNRAKVCAISSEIPEPEQIVSAPESSENLVAAAALEAQLPENNDVEKTSSDDSSAGSSNSGLFLSPTEAEEVIGNVKDSSFFTLPGELIRGQPFTMFVDVNKSEALKNCSNVKVCFV